MKKQLIILLSICLITGRINAQSNSNSEFILTSGIFSINAKDFKTNNAGYSIQAKIRNQIRKNLNLSFTVNYSKQSFIENHLINQNSNNGIIQNSDIYIQVESPIKKSNTYEISAAIGVGSTIFTTTGWSTYIYKYTSRTTGNTEFIEGLTQSQTVNMPIIFPLSISFYRNLSNNIGLSMQCNYNYCPGDIYSGSTGKSITTGLYYRF